MNARRRQFYSCFRVVYHQGGARAEREPKYSNRRLTDHKAPDYSGICLAPLLSRNSLILAVIMSIPSLIFCCEPHNVAAVDTIMDMVVKIESVMTGVVMTETAEENEIEMSKGSS